MNEQKKKPIGILLTVILISALLTVCLELGLGYLRPDTPGSIPKHLIHFAIMFVLLGGTTLLCLFCPPFKKLWAWLDKNIMTQETRPIAIEIIYAVIAGLMLLHHFYVILYYPTLPTGATKFAPVWIVFAALTVILGKSWQNIPFRLAAIFLIYTFERLYFKHLCITGNNVVYYSSAIYAMFICLGVFSTLRPSIRKLFLQTLCVLWAFGTIVLSIIGLYTIWTGNHISNLVQTITQVVDGRLWIFAYPTITATFTCCGGIMALLGLILSTKKAFRFFYSIVFLFATIANSMTDARASFFVLSFMVTSVICLKFWTKYVNSEKKKPSKMQAILVIVALMVCFGICFWGTIEFQRILGVQFIEIRNNSNIISVATAEEISNNDIQLIPTPTPNPPSIIQRDVWAIDETNINDTLSDRYEIWQLGCQYIQDNPETLFYGVSVDGTIGPIVGRPHCHNILLQTLLEGGFPALFLYLSLLFYATYHAFRLWNRRHIPFWQRILPLPVFSILLWEMAECLTHFSYGHPPMTLFWFFLGATITVGKSLGKAPKSPEIPTETIVIESGE